IISMGVIVAAAVLAFRPNERMVDLSVAFADSPGAAIVGLTQRILAEAKWLGTGAGTFAAILPIYRDIGELAAGNVAPTAAASVAVEMGRPFLWASVLAGLVLTIVLLRGAIRRGRDSFYSAAGAGCIITMMILSFNNSGVFSTTVLVNFATAV